MMFQLFLKQHWEMWLEHFKLAWFHFESFYDYDKFDPGIDRVVIQKTCNKVGPHLFQVRPLLNLSISTTIANLIMVIMVSSW